MDELLDDLDEAARLISERVHSPLLDDGQRLMLSEAEVRIAQTVKELRQFDVHDEFVDLGGEG